METDNENKYSGPLQQPSEPVNENFKTGTTVPIMASVPKKQDYANYLNSAFWALFFGVLLTVFNISGNKSFFVVQSAVGVMLFIGALWRFLPCGYCFRWAIGLYCLSVLLGSIAWFFLGVTLWANLDLSYSIGILNAILLTAVWVLLSVGFTRLYRQQQPKGKLPLRWAWLCYGVTAVISVLDGGGQAEGLAAWAGIELFIVVLILINNTRLKLIRANVASQSRPLSWRKWCSLIFVCLLLISIPFASAVVYQTREAPAEPYKQADINKNSAEALEQDRLIREQLLSFGAEPHLVGDLTQGTVQQLKNTIEVDNRIQLMELKNGNNPLQFNQNEQSEWLVWNTTLCKRQDQPGYYCIIYLEFADIEKLKAAGLEVDNTDKDGVSKPEPETALRYFSAPAMPKSCYRDELQIYIDNRYAMDFEQQYTIYEKENTTWRTALEAGTPQIENSAFIDLASANRPGFDGVVKITGKGNNQRIILCGELSGPFNNSYDSNSDVLQISIGYTHWNIPIDSPYHNLIPDFKIQSLLSKSFSWVQFDTFDGELQESADAPRLN